MRVRIMKHAMQPRRASSPGGIRNVTEKVQRSYSVNDVQLNEDQKRDLQSAYGMFKKSSKGKISARDLGPLLRCLGWNPSERDLEEARQELDISANGKIAYADVEQYIARRGGICQPIEEEEEDILNAFKVLDKFGTGKIHIRDFRRFMTTMGDRMTSEEVEEIICQAKKDNQGYILYKDLIKEFRDDP